MAVQKQGYPWVPVGGESFGTPVLPWGSAFHTDASYRGDVLFYGTASFDGDVTCKSNFHVEGTLYSNESVYDTVVTNRIQHASEDRGIKIYDGESDWVWFHANRTVSIGREAPEDLNVTLFVDDSIYTQKLHTKFLISDVPIQITNGILTNTIGVNTMTSQTHLSKQSVIEHVSVYHTRVRDTWAEAADAREITAVLPIEHALQKVIVLQGVTFQKIESTDPERYHLGLVAQEVEDHVPEVVFSDNDGSERKYVAYGNLVPLLLESIKELKSQVDAQATTIQTLQAALDTP